MALRHSTRPPAGYHFVALGNPGPPVHPLESPELRVLLAYVEFGAWGQWAAWETVLNAVLARQAGNTPLTARYLAPESPEALRAVMSGPALLVGLLGEYDLEGSWRPGLAGLSEQESRALELQSRGLTTLEIAQYMDRQRRSKRFGLNRLPVETVERHLARARHKVRALFAEG